METEFTDKPPNSDELKAFKRLVQILEPLSEDGRKRVLSATLIILRLDKTLPLE